MNKESLNLLENYLKSGLTSLLVQNVPTDIFTNSVVIPASIDRSELNGHYENIEFCPPSWYQELVEKSKTSTVILIIENINEIPQEEQTKFIGILKYKKVSTFFLPKNCLTIVTYSDLKLNKINEEVYSLLALVEG